MTMKEPTTREEVLEAFKELMAEYRERQEQVSTKAEDAARDGEREVVARAATYSVEGLLKELADLQLSVGSTFDDLAEMLVTEDTKLDELSRSIEIEKREVDRLKDVRVTAEALQLLRRDQRQRRESFEESMREQIAELDAEIAQAHERWDEEQAEHEEQVAETLAERDKQRAQEEADFEYERERRRKIAADEFEARQRSTERELDELEAELVKDWTKREAKLAEKADEIADLGARRRVPVELIEERTKEARAKAIREATEDAEVEAELTQREFEADEEVFKLQIASLEEKIAEQRTQIAELEAQLNAASSQAQELAVRAVDGTSRNRAA